MSQNYRSVVRFILQMCFIEVTLTMKNPSLVFAGFAGFAGTLARALSDTFLSIHKGGNE